MPLKSGLPSAVRFTCAAAPCDATVITAAGEITSIACLHPFLISLDLYRNLVCVSRRLASNREQWFLAHRQLLVEGSEQRRVPGMLCHQINEVDKVTFAEKLQRTSVGLRLDEVIAEKLTA